MSLTRVLRPFRVAPLITALVWVAFGGVAQAADELGTELLSIQHAWEQANYGIKDPDAKTSAFEALSARAA